MHNHNMLEVNNLSKNFAGTGRETEFAAVDGISFTLERGAVLALIGSSGGGKTTLLRCLNFLETADAGQIYVAGSCIFDASESVRRRRREAEVRAARRHFGLVFQQFNLFPQYSVLRNVTLAPTLNRLGTAEEIDARARALIDRVGLTDKLDSYPGQLSGGQQQRVAIARALALAPDILCFDEPTSALDPELTEEVLRVIKSLADGSTTMIIVTHEMAFAREAASKVAFMENGAVLEQGTPEHFFTNPQNERTKAFLSKILR